MLYELFEYCTTPCAPYARKMGYLHEVIATKARYKRCAGAWQSHLQNTKDFILKSAEVCEKKGKVVILGAGNGYDIPLKKLSQIFDEVVLVDIAFLRSTKRLAKKHGATCVQADVTAAAKYLLVGDVDAVRNAKPNFLHNTGVDLVISANIMSQLPLALIPYVEEAERYDFCTSIITAHMEYLKGFECNVCLIGDVQFFAMEGGKVADSKALYGFEFPESDAQWRWDISPYGEIADDIKKWHHVGAVSF